MSLRTENEAHFDPFPLEIDPAHEYEYEGMELKVFYMDNYPKKHQALEQQPTYIYSRTNVFYVLLEKKMYDLTPQMYSKEVLGAQCKFFSKSANQSALKIIGGGFVVTATSILLLNFFMEFLFAMMIGMVLGAGFMFYIMVQSMKKSMTVSRAELRQELIGILGEEQLDSYLKLQEDYIEKMGYNF